MAVVFRLLDQVADGTASPVVQILGQEAVAPSDVAVVRILEQHVDRGSGSTAVVRITAQSATGTVAESTPSPSGIALLSGGSWLPRTLRSSDGSGTWN